MHLSNPWFPPLPVLAQEPPLYRLVISVPGQNQDQSDVYISGNDSSDLNRRFNLINQLDTSTKNDEASLVRSRNVDNEIDPISHGSAQDGAGNNSPRIGNAPVISPPTPVPESYFTTDPAVVHYNPGDTPPTMIPGPGTLPDNKNPKQDSGSGLHLLPELPHQPNLHDHFTTAEHHDPYDADDEAESIDPHDSDSENEEDVILFPTPRSQQPTVSSSSSSPASQSTRQNPLSSTTAIALSQLRAWFDVYSHTDTDTVTDTAPQTSSFHGTSPGWEGDSEEEGEKDSSSSEEGWFSGPELREIIDLVADGLSDLEDGEFEVLMGMETDRGEAEGRASRMGARGRGEDYRGGGDGEGESATGETGSESELESIWDFKDGGSEWEKDREVDGGGWQRGDTRGRRRGGWRGIGSWRTNVRDPRFWEAFF